MNFSLLIIHLRLIYFIWEEKNWLKTSLPDLKTQILIANIYENHVSGVLDCNDETRQIMLYERIKDNQKLYREGARKIMTIQYLLSIWLFHK